MMILVFLNLTSGIIWINTCIFSLCILVGLNSLVFYVVYIRFSVSKELDTFMSCFTFFAIPVSRTDSFTEDRIGELAV